MEFFKTYHDVAYYQESSKTDSNLSHNGIDLHGGNGPTDEEEFYFSVITYVSSVHFPFIYIFNSAVMFIIWNVHRLHTSENYILFAMAFVDVMSVMNLPLDILDANIETRSLVRGTHALCVFRFAMPILWDNTSLLLLTAMCIGRYSAIVHPFWYIKNVGGQTSIKITVGVLLWGVFFNVILFAFALEYKEDKHDLREKCSYQNTPDWYRHLSFSILILNLVVSFLLSVRVAYVALKQLRNTKEQHSLEKHMGRRTDLQQRQQVHHVQTMLFLMFTFLVVWVPVTAIPTVYKRWDFHEAEIYLAVTRHFLYLNASANTVVYGFSKPTFKTSYKYLLTHRPCLWKELNYHILRENSLYLGSKTKSCDFHKRKGKVSSNSKNQTGESFSMCNSSEMEQRPRAVTFAANKTIYKSKKFTT